MIEISVIWGGIVVFLALLIKHEFVAKRANISDLYDRELMAVSKQAQAALDEANTLRAALDIASSDYEALAERFLKLERQINDAQIAKTLGRR
jgi:hypothetical protein